ncbi:MAG TPA: aminotransferase class I/II-fold pyridoxal phosphate-dependent enzyme [Corynebacterium sp.]|uniref:aminotransferase class I/II-fold pyridoxal phosphate-dependent enzyme n=1 Tax=Corynebacterium sp. TaxID=1720 RepID=UPI00181F6E00|nr:aminotransferase class I/II-fold pyridoxal phosphate-dependent enzyme [Corynebacterium sp.]HHT31644.1 aminotransferase class I/II-fold pyridoxal phosphate-dependent enzyme [Corynebacterium sp.]
MMPSKRSEVAPFHVMDVLAAAQERQRTHGDALFLCAGQPSTPAPRRALEAVQSAVGSQILGYTEATGIPGLKRAIADDHNRRMRLRGGEGRGGAGREVVPEDVVVTTGSSGGFVTLFLAALDPGDDIVLARPGYPAYRNTLQALGANVIEIDCGPETRFQLTAELLEGLERVPRAVIVTSPDNPTGTIIDGEELGRIARWCEANDVLLVSDEIYHGISFGRECVSAREFSDAAVVVGSVSKYHSMTGWRVGWLIIPEWLRGPCDRLAANLTVCPPAVSQFAAIEAFHPESIAELDGHVRRYAANRELLIERLPAAGLGTFAPPDGGFYVYADVSHLTDDSLTWARELLDATGVAVAPGVDFDVVAGHEWVRLCFAGSTEDMAEACRRIGAFNGK